MFDLAGRVVVITGGNGGIGLGMAEAVGAAGASVVIWGRNTDKNAAAVEHLGALGVESHAVAVDVTDEGSVDGGFANSLAAFGHVDTMIANAGMGFPGPVHQLSLEDWRRATAVNLDGAFLCFRAASRYLIERGEGGSLIGISSTSAIHGAPGNEGYSASKAAVLALVRGLAVELARHRIRCNSIMPGWTETDMTAPLMGWEKFMASTVARTPVRRWGVPADLGPAAVFLADPTLTFHTGDCIVVDGGYTIF
jgi:NAD(P)-dependent dehydrogenase (short-subunit alcohol dehydrogenase family)